MRFGGKLGLTFASVFIGLALCELAVRLMDNMPVWSAQNFGRRNPSFLDFVRPAEFDPMLGWRQRANLGPELLRSTGLVTGEHGARMNTREIRPLPQEAILAVGDSFTAGSEVVEHETYPAQLENLLGRAVINAGVGGYGTDQMILSAYRLVPILNPRLLVVGILDDDINRTGYKLYGGARKPWFTVSAGKLVHHNDPVPLPTQPIDREPHWLGHSYLALWTASRLGHDHLIRFRTPQFIPAENDPVAVTCTMLSDLRSFANAHRTAVLIVMLYAGSARILETDKRTEKIRPVQVHACATRLGLGVVDLWDTLVAIAARDMDAYRSLYTPHGPDFGHMTRAGNGLVAESVAEWVKTTELSLTIAHR